MRTGKARAQGFVAASLLVVAGLLADGIQAQAVHRQTDDPVNIVGTWATGSGQVETGLVSFPPFSLCRHALTG
jgi:hypothetical protein